MKSVIVLLAVNFVLVDGHGYLLVPASRAKQAGHSTPQGWNCGGISKQFDTHGGKCGVCGDEYGAIQENMAGGKWAPGVITGTYVQGQMIDVTVKITANHLGDFNFSLCVNNNFQKEITEECLEKHVLDITDPVTGTVGKKWPLPGDVSLKVLRLKLPDDVHCEQCVLRWYWKAGNNWGRDPETGKGCKGCGYKQECFVNCADIEIKPSGEPNPVTMTPPTTTTKATTTTTDPNNAPCVDDMYISEDNGKRCTSNDSSLKDVGQWCETICSRSNFCPKSHCVCY